jgi:hypothetical protein
VVLKPVAPVLLLALLLTQAPLQAQTAGVILVVEDRGAELTEPLGLAAYGRLLEQAPYAEVRRLRGTGSTDLLLAEAIRDLAGRHDAVDLILSTHTSFRNHHSAFWQEQVPEEARAKLRLVYSAACTGHAAERETWESLGARCVVTHRGMNVPVLALPTVLAAWAQGMTIGDATAMGYTDTQRAYRLLASIPGLGRFAAGGADGSTPILSGDAELTVTSGVPGVGLRAPRRELVFSQRTGGALGLVLRALALEGYSATGEDLRSYAWDATAMSGTFGLALPLPPELLEAVVEVRAEDRRRGWLTLELARPQELEAQGFTLRLARQVRIRLGRFDLDTQRLELHTRGISAHRGLLGVTVSTLTIEPDPARGGYRLHLQIGLLGLIPWSHSIHLGGVSDPLALEELNWPRRQPSGRGLAGAID